MDGVIEAADEGDRVQVFAPTIPVGDPLSRLAREVEVEHRGHSIHAQAVNVVLIQPEDGVADQELADLVAAVVEDERAPIEVTPLARVVVLIEVSAVEEAERELVGGEVGRNPVDQDADALLVAGVDEGHEVVRRAEAAGGRVEAGHLVAPRLVGGMLGHWQQLDVAEAHLLDVGDEVVDEVAVSQPLPAVLAPPGAEMQFVDVHRRAEALALAARGHPVVVLPLVLVDVPDHRGVLWP